MPDLSTDPRAEIVAVQLYMHSNSAGGPLDFLNEAVNLLANIDAVDVACGIRRVADERVPGRWWRAVGPDGLVWCESSDSDEVRESMRPGDTLMRQYVSEQQPEWRETP